MQISGKEVKFDLSIDCVNNFEKQKRKLVTSLIFISPNLALQFELMCDASDMPVRVCWDKER